VGLILGQLHLGLAPAAFAELAMDGHAFCLSALLVT
jgi:hypothetical protein